MTHFVEELRDQAEAAIARMRAAALEARQVHARAELMRHMLGTAQKMRGMPRPEAIDQVVSEWMAAWHLDRGAWGHVAREMEGLTTAFLDYCDVASEAADGRVREGCAQLEAALAQEGTTVADQMAWRSQCAHRWWELVVPVPAGSSTRAGVPPLDPAAPFWESGCAERCL